MEQNPYQTPTSRLTDLDGGPDGPGKALREQVRLHLKLDFWVLSYPIIVVMVGLLSFGATHRGFSFVPIAFLISGTLAFCAVGVYRRGKTLFGPTVGALVGAFTAVPCVGYFVMFMVHAYSHRNITKQGVRFGCMGPVFPKELEPSGESHEERR